MVVYSAFMFHLWKKKKYLQNEAGFVKLSTVAKYELCRCSIAKSNLKFSNWMLTNFSLENVLHFSFFNIRNVILKSVFSIASVHFSRQKILILIWKSVLLSQPTVDTMYGTLIEYYNFCFQNIILIDCNIFPFLFFNLRKWVVQIIVSSLIEAEINFLQLKLFRYGNR